MENLKESKDKQIIEEIDGNKLNHQVKKYNVHGKITTSKESGTTEISYYECDDIQCTKKIIK